MNFSESIVEDVALAWLQGMGDGVLHVPAITVGDPRVERSGPNHCDIIFEWRQQQITYSGLEKIVPSLRRLRDTLLPKRILS